MIRPIRALFRWLAEPAMVIVLVFGATTAIAQPFYVPSGSMEPTLRIGDAMLASKFAYGYSAASLPVMLGAQDGGRWLGRLPKRGDVVIFRLPGDRVQMVQGRLVINGKALPLADAGTGHVEGPDGAKIAIHAFIETLPNGVRHSIYKRRWDGMLENTPEIAVPEGHLFVMGDNRDNSSDSRVAPEDGGVGLLPVADLIGRAEILLGSYDFRNTHGPASWPAQLRLSRFFRWIA